MIDRPVGQSGVVFARYDSRVGSWTTIAVRKRPVSHHSSHLIRFSLPEGSYESSIHYNYGDAAV